MQRRCSGPGGSAAGFGGSVTGFGGFLLRYSSAAVTTAFTAADGFAARIKAVADAASDKFEGSVTNAITSHSTTITKISQTWLASQTGPMLWSTRVRSSAP